MINYEKLIKKARLAAGNAEEESAEEKKFCKIIKYLKYRQDKNIYRRKETNICWNEKYGKSKETRVEIVTIPAKNFADYLDEKHKATIFENVYLFE